MNFICQHHILFTNNILFTNDIFILPWLEGGKGPFVLWVKLFPVRRHVYLTRWVADCADFSTLARFMLDEKTFYYFSGIITSFSVVQGRNSSRSALISLQYSIYSFISWKKQKY